VNTDEFDLPKGYNSIQTTNLKFCHNYQFSVCNWLIEDNGVNKFCKACELNRKVPNQSDTEGFKKWQKLETAKHRLIYQLIKLKLPIDSRFNKENGIAFDFISENNKDKLVTGHSNGVITILLSEADSVHREQLKKQMHELYRTLLGHFRHEIGHYYWMLLFESQDNLQAFRIFFGDETQDYSLALETHYKNGAPSNWNQKFISKYASSHPWEDWAETWAHYLHIMDTLETGHNLGLTFTDSLAQNHLIRATTCPNPYTTDDFKTIFDANMQLTSAVNSLNRSMGVPDIYPFIVPNEVFKKLDFIHHLLLKG
tara:strand:- start:96 stop:1031 length:936 start_codon:yes stop_codon:yes gene_type:complete